MSYAFVPLPSVPIGTTWTGLGQVEDGHLDCARHLDRWHSNIINTYIRDINSIYYMIKKIKKIQYMN